MNHETRKIGRPKKALKKKTVSLTLTPHVWKAASERATNSGEGLSGMIERLLISELSAARPHLESRAGDETFVAEGGRCVMDVMDDLKIEIERRGNTLLMYFIDNEGTTRSGGRLKTAAEATDAFHDGLRQWIEKNNLAEILKGLNRGRKVAKS